MKKFFFYTQLLAVVSLLYACGGNQRDNMQDSPMDQDVPYEDGTIPMDSLERDSLDTMERMMPTPPLD